MWNDTCATYLHISDLHLRKDKMSSMAQAEMGFLKDIEKHQADIDLIVLTGDLAFSGNAGEYSFAKKWIEDNLLDKLNLNWDKLYIIPGNHDVDRDLFNKSVFSPLLSAKSSEQYQEELYQLWNHKATREFIENKFEAYKSFFNNSTVIFPNPFKTSWACTFEKNQFRLSIIGANSAWAAGYDGDDQQKIIVGESQLQEALDSLPKTIGPEARLLLAHHPLECLHPIDQRHVRGWINRNIDFNLCGHTHELLLENTLTKHPYATWITSGAMFLNRRFSHTYNIVNIGPCSIRIKLRRYGPNNNFYGADTLSYQEASENGILSWQWRRRPRVYIAGSSVKRDKTDLPQNEIREHIRKLTIGLLERGISVWATSRVPGVGAEVWAAGWQWCEENGIVPASALGDAGLYPVSKELISCIPDLVSARSSYIGMQDAVISFGGGDGTEQEINAALNCKIPVLAVGWAGGSSKRFSGACQSELSTSIANPSTNSPNNNWAVETANDVAGVLWADRERLSQERG